MRPRNPSRLAAAVALAAIFVPTAARSDSGSGPFGHELIRPGDGSRVKIAAGAPALHVVFLAIWCPPCVAELDGLAELEARWGERGYRLVLIPVRHRHTAERLEQFRLEYETPGELLFDSTGSAQQASKVDGLPTHLVFDAAGKEVTRAGSLDKQVTGSIELLLEKKRPRGGS